MDEARLAEIVERSQRFTSANEAEYLGVPEMVAEVRRLRKLERDMIAWVEEMCATYPVQR